MILVTGASGFVGTHLVQYLSARGYNVRALYHKTVPGEELRSLPGVEWQSCDLLDVFAVEEVMQDVTEVYHCAGIVSFDAKDKEALLHFNVESTVNVVNEALESGVRKLLFMSSVAALGRSEHKDKPITEEEQWEESKYNSVYGLSKHLAETEVWRGIAEGLNAVIINPATMLGEGNWDQGSARLVKVVDGEFPFYTEGVNAWVDVQDVVRVAYLLMNSDVEAERFIVSAGNFAFKDVFTRLAKAMGRKPPHIKAGRFLSGLVWRWNAIKSLWGAKSSVTKETAHTAQRRSIYDNSKLLSALPSFAYTPFDDTVARVAKAYLRDKGQ